MTTAAGDGIGHNNNNKRSGATAIAEAAAGNAGPRRTKRPCARRACDIGPLPPRAVDVMQMNCGAGGSARARCLLGQ